MNISYCKISIYISISNFIKKETSVRLFVDSQCFTYITVLYLHDKVYISNHIKNKCKTNIYAPY